MESTSLLHGKNNVSNKQLMKEYHLDVSVDSFSSRINNILKKNDFVVKNDDTVVTFYKNTSLTFSSTKPLTCISSLSLYKGSGGSSGIRIGMTFTKIKYYTIFIMLLFCVALPITLGMLQYGRPDIPPMAYVGIPLGFFIHYHVRARAVRYLGRLVRQIERELEAENQ